MNIQVYTRSCNDKLYAMMRSLIPEDVVCHQVKGYDGYEMAEPFIRHVLETAEDIAMIIDEDAFVYDWSKILWLAKQMIKGWKTHAGVSDCGTIEHRRFSWTTINPFFNILDCATLRATGGLAPVNMPSGATMAEPFDPLYLQLWRVGKPLFLPASEHHDGISTDTYFLLHSWFSREYGTSDYHTKRIDSLYDEAVNKAKNH